MNNLVAFTLNIMQMQCVFTGFKILNDQLTFVAECWAVFLVRDISCFVLFFLIVKAVITIGPTIFIFSSTAKEQVALSGHTVLKKCVLRQEIIVLSKEIQQCHYLDKWNYTNNQDQFGKNILMLKWYVQLWLKIYTHLVIMAVLNPNNPYNS